MSRKPLSGVRVLEMGQLMAGPFAGTILAYYGAEVIKIEPPKGGDPVRVWRMMDGGTSLWWRSLGRNKKCITVDLRKEEGRALAKRIAGNVDGGSAPRTSRRKTRRSSTRASRATARPARTRASPAMRRYARESAASGS
jgi:hypothetical protein